MTAKGNAGTAPRRRLRIAAAVAAGLLLGAGACTEVSAAGLVSGGATVAGAVRFSVNETVHGAGGRRWRAAYDVALDGHRAAVAVRIRLVAGAGVTAADVERWRVDWKPAIEAAWSGSVALVDGAGRALPLAVSVVFAGHDAHHVVVLKRRIARIDAMAWPLFPRPGMIAHEFGHLIGAFDEYPGGATDPDAPVIDPEGIMAAGSGGSPPRPRHFHHILRAINDHAAPVGAGKYRLVPRAIAR